MKRTRIKRHAPPDRLSPEERRHVLQRDGECIARILARKKIVPPDECRNHFGDPIYVFTLADLTYEHVKPHAAMGKRAPSADGVGRRHGVACCWAHNVNGWTSKNRAAIREYLAALEQEGRL